MSMATRFGIPLAVALGDRLRCAVLGKFGLLQGPALHRELEMPEGVAADASRVGASLGYNGAHSETEPVAVALWRGFVCRHLLGVGGR
jgi:hypothetical protein